MPVYRHNISNIVGIATPPGICWIRRWANEALGVELPGKESHTIGGLVMARLRHIPGQGESIVDSGYRFTLQEATARTIVKLRVEPAARAP